MIRFCQNVSERCRNHQINIDPCTRGVAVPLAGEHPDLLLQGPGPSVAVHPGHLSIHRAANYSVVGAAGKVFRLCEVQHILGIIDKGLKILLVASSVYFKILLNYEILNQ